MKFLSMVALVLAVGVAGRVEADSKGAVQGVPDETGILVQKNIGSERWSITLDLERGTVSGNVFRSSGGEAAFVFCVITDAWGDDPYTMTLNMGCYGADRCQQVPCLPSEQWRVLGPVQIPGSFFLP